MVDFHKIKIIDAQKYGIYISLLLEHFRSNHVQTVKELNLYFSYLSIKRIRSILEQMIDLNLIKKTTPFSKNLNNTNYYELEVK